MIFESKWEKIFAKHLQHGTDKTDKKGVKGGSVSFGSSIAGHSEQKKSVSWLERYPGLDPDEWQVLTLQDGSIHGRKVKGKQKGMIAFLIPPDYRPASEPEQLEEEWEFRTVEIAGDTWEIGRRVKPERPRREIATKVREDNAGLAGTTVGEKL